LCRQLGEEPAAVGLAWLLHNPVVTAPIIGPRTLGQLEGAAQALKVSLSAETLARLDEILAWPRRRGPRSLLQLRLGPLAPRAGLRASERGGNRRIAKAEMGDTVQVTIDRDECISCAACWTACPEFFEPSPDDGLSQVVEQYRAGGDPSAGAAPGNLDDCVREAAGSCPVEIIHIRE